MRRAAGFTLFLLLFLAASPALAAKAPAAQLLGSARAAEHLVTHIYAYTCGWSGEGPSLCPDEGCPAYGHVHCYGVRVNLWDTPAKGTSRVPYYPGGTSAQVGPDTQFQLVDVVAYRGGYYACIRVEHEGRVICSGFVNADYVGCDCEGGVYEGFEPVPEYEHDVGAFSLK